MFVVLFSLTIVNAQKFNVEEGKLKNLKGISEYNLVFDYTDVKIPKFKNEEAFLKEKMAKREKKQKGSGEVFRKSWFEDRENRYEPKFIASFNKRFKKGNIKVDKNLNSAKYVMKIHTTKIYPGYNVGMWRHDAEINTTVTIFEKNNPNNTLVSGTFKDVRGRGAMGNDYNSGYRISESYAKLAKIMAKYIKKQNR
ncbi:MAG: hypothetical protein CSA38_00965 [Flavobacteriales bacterium]|nr:MAG: hypothetical protein CSA38_00965 [Flavobacteriales bacterium]